MSYRSRNRATRSYSSKDSNTDLAPSEYSARTNKEANPRFPIKLEGLGDDLYTINVTVRATTLMLSVERNIRAYPGMDIQESDSVYLYRDDKILLRSDRVGSNSQTIQFHVFRDLSNDYTRSTQVLTASSTPSSVGEVHVAIHPLPRNGFDDPTTVAEVRRTYARREGIRDPNTLIVRLVGGLRTGPVEGNDWQFGKVAEWLPDNIVVTQLLRPSYLVLRGCGKEYLYQVPCADGDGFSVGRVKQWLVNKLVRSVHHALKSRISVDAPNIYLYLDDKLLSRDTLIVEWTAEIDFRLPADVEKAFVTEEAWLCPTSECPVCREAIRYEPPRVSASCTHKPSVCTPCVSQWVSLCLAKDGWNKARCPECSEPLEYHEIKAYASTEQFDRYVLTISMPGSRGLGNITNSQLDMRRSPQRRH